MYISDTDNNRIRKVTAATGIISTVAGNGTGTFAGDGGPATLASISVPYVAAVDGAGNLYIGDQYNQRIRKVSAKGGISFPTATAAGSAETTDGVQLLTLNNIGNTALTLSSMQNNIGSYVMANPMSGGCSTAVSVAAGASCLLREQFQQAAGSSGVVPGSLAITDNSLNVLGSVQYVPLLGTTSAGSINVSATTTSVTAGTASTSITVIVGYSGTTADTGAITLTVNGSASGVGTPTCTSKGGHENCAYPYTGTALAIAGSYPVVASVAADFTDNYAAGSAFRHSYRVPGRLARLQAGPGHRRPSKARPQRTLEQFTYGSGAELDTINQGTTPSMVLKLSPLGGNGESSLYL